MTESQAEKIILLLESIDRRLKSVIDGDDTLDVTVHGPVTVETAPNEPIQIWPT